MDSQVTIPLTLRVPVTTGTWEKPLHDIRVVAFLMSSLGATVMGLLWAASNASTRNVQSDGGGDTAESLKQMLLSI